MFLKAKMDLSGHIALVTGGTGWLGASICEVLCELGATVYATSRGLSTDFSEGLKACKQFTVIEANMTSDAQMATIVSEIIEKHGRIDILVNNAYSWPKEVNFEKASWERMTDTFDSGVTAPLMLIKEVLPHMIAKSRGSIINVCSMYAHVTPDCRMYKGQGGNAIEYGASKAAMAQATRYVAQLAGRSGVRCNSISPGPFPRPGAFEGKEWFRQELENRTMLGRVGSPDELKGVIAFLASEQSSFVTGVDIPVDGGWTAW